MRKRTILVVEDNALNRAMLREVLEEDYTVIEAADGLEGLEFLEQHYTDISLILLDIYMPRCDGFEFLRRKAKESKYDTVPVVVATAGGSKVELTCLELGANDFVLKPYDFDIIVNRVNNLIRLRESAMIVNRLTWDADTGLYNKEFFYRAMEDKLLMSAENDYDVVIAEVDNYASLLDRHGEELWKAFIKSFTVQVNGLIPDCIAGGRINSHVLGFLVPSTGRDWEKALALDKEALTLSNANVVFGVVERVDHDMAPRKSCSLAMSAASIIKDRYGVHVALFDDELHKQQMLEQIIRESMETALGELQFSVFYQPKHNVHTGHIGGAEALVRWFHPTVGFISPGLFIPIFERSGFITKLDLYVWEEACREVTRCKELGLPCVPISVNASRLDFDLPDLPTRLAELADKYGVDHSHLHVELTETAYSDNPQKVIDTLGELKALGFNTELDDFGSGYSSLVSLNTLPLDVMKLDMSMVRKATELNDFRIVESTINLAQVLDLETVVEGVETAEEAKRVTEIGCDFIQGYYYSRPLKRDEFEEYLRNDHMSASKGEDKA